MRLEEGFLGIDSDLAEPGGTEKYDVSSQIGVVEVRTVRVHILEGPDQDQSFLESKPVISIGSRPGVDVVLSDPTVSRRHVEIRQTPDGLWLADLGSRNGTHVGGTPIKEALVPESARIKIGATTFQVSLVQLRPRGDTMTPVQFGAYLTEHPALKETVASLGRIARSEATVLIHGETGTGKELLARAVHDQSPRAERPYMVVDCGALSPTLLESQLFGHKKGAFTGALEDQEGALEAGNGGTVFLDEIGDMPLELQPKLLRALEARTIRRLGEVVDRTIDVRFVAATHRNLKDMVEDGSFRSDLYYRLAVVPVVVPPLKERPEDVSLLAQHFCEAFSRGSRTLSPETFACLQQHTWPGNARELRNVIQRAVAAAQSSVLHPQDLFPSLQQDESSDTFQAAKDKVISVFERRYVTALLKAHDNNISQAAKAAGLSRTSLYGLMRRVGVDKPA